MRQISKCKRFVEKTHYPVQVLADNAGISLEDVQRILNNKQSLNNTAEEAFVRYVQSISSDTANGELVELRRKHLKACVIAERLGVSSTTINRVENFLTSSPATVYNYEKFITEALKYTDTQKSEDAMALEAIEKEMEAGVYSIHDLASYANLSTSGVDHVLRGYGVGTQEKRLREAADKARAANTRWKAANESSVIRRQSSVA